MVIKIYADGSCWNGQPAQDMGIAVATFIDNKFSEEHSRSIKYVFKDDGVKRTNNLAENMGVYEALEIGIKLKDLYPEAIIKFYSDSQLICNQLDFYLHLTEHFKIDKSVKEQIDSFKINWIPREENSTADFLSRLALNKLHKFSKLLVNTMPRIPVTEK